MGVYLIEHDNALNHIFGLHIFPSVYVVNADRQFQSAFHNALNDKVCIIVLAVVFRNVPCRAESVKTGDIIRVLSVLTLHVLYHIALLEHYRASVLAP